MADETPVEPTTRGLTYRDAGVDIDAGNEVVDRIRDAVLSTQDDRVLKGSHGAFGGFFRLLDGNGSLFGNDLDDPILVGATDGVGTKLKVAFECGDLDTVGIDMFAMCVNDLVVGSSSPLFSRLRCHRQDRSRIDRRGGGRNRRGMSAGGVRTARW